MRLSLPEESTARTRVGRTERASRNASQESSMELGECECASCARSRLPAPCVAEQRWPFVPSRRQAVSAPRGRWLCDVANNPEWLKLPLHIPANELLCHPAAPATAFPKQSRSLCRLV